MLSPETVRRIKVAAEHLGVDLRRRRISLAPEGSRVEGTRGDYQAYLKQQRREPEATGFNALAEYDLPAKGGNADGLITERDAIFVSLLLWQDSNHNGVSEANELHALKQMGLTGIECNYKESKRTDEHGNRFRYRAKLDDARGAKAGRWAWDVFLVFGPEVRWMGGPMPAPTAWMHHLSEEDPRWMRPEELVRVIRALLPDRAATPAPTRRPSPTPESKPGK